MIRINFLVGAILPLLLLAAWAIGSQRMWWPPTLLAPPYVVAVKALEMTGNGTLLGHSLVSLQRLTAGFFAGSITGIAIGILVGYSRFLQRLLAPMIGLLAPIPVTAWIPLLIVSAGIGELTKVLLIAIGVFFPMFFGTFQGIRSADQKLIELAQVLGKGSRSILVHILIPSAVAWVLPAMRSALGLGWVLLVVAEVIAASNGLGWLMADARTYRRIDEVIIAMAAAGILGAITDALLASLQSRLLFWKQSFDGH